jgi:chromosome segregation ATPase
MQDTPIVITAKMKRMALYIGIALVVLVAGFFIIKLLINRQTPMPVEMKAQVDSLKNEVSDLKRNQVTLTEYIKVLETSIGDKEKRGEVIKQDIDRNESRKINLPKQYEKVSTAVDNMSDDSISRILQQRYGHKQRDVQ